MVMEQYTGINLDPLIWFDEELPDAEEDGKQVAWQPLTESGFHQDLTDLLKLLAKLKTKGVEDIRLYITLQVPALAL